jgi:RHS repeat-associated protein
MTGTGTIAKDNPFRFSTKRTEDNTDLVLYEYRAYSPSLGRWPNRDPLGEAGFHVLLYAAGADIGPEEAKGEHNPYAIVNNRVVNTFDSFGLAAAAGEECDAICGPDVTDALERLVLGVLRTWNGWSESQQKAACKGLTSRDADPTRGGGPAWLNAWDIDLLFNKTWINTTPYCPPCATPQSTCKERFRLEVSATMPDP